ncbi:MAG: hypothetical protein ACKVT1_01995 [Dehalococcoidia bacterium]
MAGLLGLAWGLAAACGGSSGPANPTVAPTSPAPSPLASAAATATATATPDTLGPRPQTADDAIKALSRFLAASPGELCPARLKLEWETVCVEGEVDGDGKKDAAYLLPLNGRDGRGPSPAVVLVRRAAASVLDAFEPDGTADAGDQGKGVFALADRTGGGRHELTFLASVCGASNCNVRVEVHSWDGTAWRGIGPGDSFANPDLISVTGTGAATRIVVHAGALQTVGAGPPRAALSTYELKQGRFQLAASSPDPLVYFAHAIFDADARFDVADWEGAITAYRSAIADEKLRDWQKDTGTGDGRKRLTAYALFRIAVATAASGDDPRPAIEAVLLEGSEQVFSLAAEEFRRGFLERGGVAEGCVKANVYLGAPDIRAYLEEVFDYGYANPQRTYRDVCPL